MDYKAIAEQVGPRVGATQEWIFHVLREGIISGKLPGGMQLKQDEISAALNVSHIPVREALRRLEAQGLVRIHANRGAAVTELTRSELLDMMEVRATLSVMMMRGSAPIPPMPGISRSSRITSTGVSASRWSAISPVVALATISWITGLPAESLVSMMFSPSRLPSLEMSK